MMMCMLLVWVCVCVCCPRAANLHMADPEMHHDRLLLCGVANGSSLGLSHVVEVETR